MRLSLFVRQFVLTSCLLRFLVASFAFSKDPNTQQRSHHRHLIDDVEKCELFEIEKLDVESTNQQQKGEQSNNPDEHSRQQQQLLHKRQCLKCKREYVLSFNGLNCVPITQFGEDMANCIQIGIFEECIECDCGYAHVNGYPGCVPAPPSLHGCQHINDIYCLRPKPEFQIIFEDDSLSKFSSIVKYSHGTHCEIKRKNECTQCHHGYKLSMQRTCEKVAGAPIRNSYYSYFEGDELKSRGFQLIAIGSEGVYLPIEDCENHVLVSDSFATTHVIECTKCPQGKSLNQSHTHCYKQPFDMCGEVSNDEPSECVICIEPTNYYLQTFETQGSSSNNGRSAPNKSYLQACIPRSKNLYDGCLKYHEFYDGCEECQDPFILQEFKCVLTSEIELIDRLKFQSSFLPSMEVQNCALYLSEVACLECEVGYTLTTHRGCMREIDAQCEVTDMNRKCVKCESGLIQEENDMMCRLKFSSQTCMEFDYFSGECVMCHSGFYLVYKTKCVEMDNCLGSNGIDKICERCNSLNYPYRVSETEQTCFKIREADYCSFSSGYENECTICKRNYIKQPNGLCKPFVKHNMHACDSYGFYLPSGSGNLQDAFCEPHSERTKNNCALLNPSTDACLKCKSSYFLVDFPFGLCGKIDACQNSDGYTNKCIQAGYQNGFIDIDGEISANKKQNCFTNGINPTCVKFDRYASIKLSLYIDETGKEHSEFDESEFSDRVKQNCFVLARQSGGGEVKCVECLSLFYLNAQSECEAITVPSCILSNGKHDRCLVCNSNLDLDEIKGSCKPIIAKVERCKVMLEHACVECDSLYYPVAGGNFCTLVSNPYCEFSDGKSDFCLLKVNNGLLRREHQFCIEAEKKDFSRCLKCAPEFFLRQNLLKVITCIANEQIYCAKITSDNLCEECMEGYYKSSKMYEQQICVKITIPHCLKVEDFTTKCIKCEEPYFVTQKGRCVRIENCALFNGKRCVSCENLYALTRIGRCEIIEKCQLIEDNACVICESGFYLSDSRLACRRIQHCLASHGRDNQCEVCFQNFVRIAFICQSISPIDHCIEYETHNKCAKCQQLFFLDSESKQCEPILEYNNCALSDGIHNECLLCEKVGGFILSSKRNGCVKVENCAISNGRDSCVFCSRLFYLSTEINESSSYQETKLFKCTRVPQQIKHCRFYNNFLPECQECESLFYLSEDRLSCFQIQSASETLIKRKQCLISNGKTDNCMICFDSNRIFKSFDTLGPMFPQLRSKYFENYVTSCNYSAYFGNTPKVACSMNYYMASNECLPRGQESEEHCKHFYPKQNSCRVCENGYILIHGTELPYGNFCAPIPRAERVENCEEYETNSNICLKCKQSELLDIQEFEYDPTLNACVNILSQYRCLVIQSANDSNLNSNSCSKSSNQVESLAVMKHIPFCEKETPKCAKCIEQVCLICKQGYYLKQGICEKQAYLKGCVEYSLNNWNRCLNCKQGFFFLFNQCSPNTEIDCEIQNSSTGQCFQCKQGYAFAFDRYGCKQTNIPHCQQLIKMINVDDRCQSCNKNYEFDDDGNCVLKHFEDPNCLTFMNNSLDAPKSIGNSTLSSSKNNKTYTCSICKEGYFSSEKNGCLKLNSVCSMRACLQYNVTSLPDQYHCAKCADGFEVNDQKQCELVKSGKENRKDDENEDKKKKQSEDENQLEKGIGEQGNNANQQSGSGTSTGFTAILVVLILVVVLCAIVFFWYLKKQKSKAKSKNSDDILSDSIMILQMTNKQPQELEDNFN